MMAIYENFKYVFPHCCYCPTGALFYQQKTPLNLLRGEKNRLKDFQILSGVIADLKRTADLPRKMKEIESWLNGG